MQSISTKVPFLDNTVTRVLLLTHFSTQEPISTHRPIPEALRTPLSPYMDISLDDLECYLGEDDAVAVPFTRLEVYREQFPQLHVVPFENVLGIGKKTCGIQTGVFKVSYMDREFIYKEPHWPDDVIAQTNEIESLIRLSESPHVIRLHSLVFSQHPYLTDKTNTSLTVIRGILLFYASQGNLGSLLKNTNIDISWNQRLLWARQIASGLQDIHAANLSHLDIKSNNIVIDDRNNALIIDFGRTGLTYGWSAPETMVEAELSELPLSLLQIADIYSFGVLLWEIATRKNVDIPIDMDHTVFFTLDMYEVPTGYKELVKGCLDHNPDHRPTLATIVQELRTICHGNLEFVKA